MHTYWEIEIDCLLCARPMGRVMLEREHAPIPLHWLAQRCQYQACGGQATRGEAIRRIVEPVDKWPYEVRRGRPPKVLVEV